MLILDAPLSAPALSPRPRNAINPRTQAARHCLRLPSSHSPLCGRPRSPNNMNLPSTKVSWATVTLLLLLLLPPALLSPGAAAQPLPDCCRQKTCSCRLYELLHGAGNHAAGILTLGKRRPGPAGLQGRLQRLLLAGGNHAAGILTMGRRSDAQPGPRHGL